MSTDSKGRHISILQYFEQLQLEYLLYELRTKIYPSKSEKERYKGVLDFKRDKIQDIADKNCLATIFDADWKRKEIEELFYNDFGTPKDMSKRDKYFYYFIGSDFSYSGVGVKLLHYNLKEGIATIEDNGDEIEVDITRIKRIL